jgi:hypothetical protein
MRPDVRVDDAVRRLEADGLDHIFVTTVGGELVGLLELDSLHV